MNRDLKKCYEDYVLLKNICEKAKDRAISDGSGKYLFDIGFPHAAEKIRNRKKVIREYFEEIQKKLFKGKVFIIDEIENSLHPLLMEKLFDLILNNKRFKDSESQLIASTHQVHLLDIKKLFRKDEIWFIEKNRNGESLAYSLANTDVEDLDLVKGYLNGRFGAIPFVRNVKELGWEA